MIVFIDNKEVEREIYCYNVEMRRYEPVLHPGEEAIWLTGDYAPTIVQGRNEEP